MTDIAPMRIVIAGGSGFLGRSLARHLARRPKTKVIILSRNRPAEEGPWTFQSWDARNLCEWSHVLEGATAVVNLVGRTVDCIKTPGNRAEIMNSRVDATRVLGEAMHDADVPPPVWVQMSTAHIYGDPPTEICDESSPTGTGLAPEVGEAWERTFHEHCPPKTRGVVLRTSFVIGRGGGALARLLALALFAVRFRALLHRRAPPPGERVGGPREGVVHHQLEDIIPRDARQHQMLPDVRGQSSDGLRDPPLRRLLGVQHNNRMLGVELVGRAPVQDVVGAELKPGFYDPALRSVELVDQR
mgnify:CR=1 FL=1